MFAIYYSVGKYSLIDVVTSSTLLHACAHAHAYMQQLAAAVFGRRLLRFLHHVPSIRAAPSHGHCAGGHRRIKWKARPLWHAAASNSSAALATSLHAHMACQLTAYYTAHHPDKEFEGTVIMR